MSHPVMSHPIMSHLVISHPVMSHLIMSHPVMSLSGEEDTVIVEADHKGLVLRKGPKVQGGDGTGAPSASMPQSARR